MKIKFLVIVSILFLSCTKGESNTVTDKKAINLVTGINLRGNIDDTPWKLGNPNVLVKNKFIMYPNPTPQKVYFYTKQNITDIWVIPARPEKIHQDLDFSSILSSDLYSEQDINSQSYISSDVQSSNVIEVNGQNLENGYYKVFLKIDGEIYWDIFYKCNNVKQDLPTITRFWN